MKKIFTSVLFSLFCLVSLAQNDTDGCKDYELFPSRIPGYYIGNCETNEYSSHTVLTANGEKVIEGKKWVYEYFLQSGSSAVSETFVRKNYMEAMKKLNAKIEYEHYGRGVAHLKKVDGSEIWVDIGGYVGDGTPEETGHFYLTIIEIAAMEQVITAKSLGDELKNTGKTVLYIQFETAKSTIKEESIKIIEQMATLLNSDKSLKVYIVGHTDNEGSLETNMKLAEDRATAVVNVLTSKFKVSPIQLISKGIGPLSPIANNNSEAGKKLNRRVEMVKQ